MRLLSLGTMDCKRYYRKPKKDLGIVDWVKEGEIIDLLMDGGSTGAIHYYCESILGPHYKRFNPSIDDNISLSAVDQIPKIINYAENWDDKVIDELANWVQGFFL